MCRVLEMTMNDPKYTMLAWVTGTIITLLVYLPANSALLLLTPKQMHLGYCMHCEGTMHAMLSLARLLSKQECIQIHGQCK